MDFYSSGKDLWNHFWKPKRAKQNKRTDNHLPIIMGCGSLFTPTPALVLAATSTRYWIPGYRPPITTDRMAASTVLLIWNRVSLPRHQIWDKSWCVKKCEIFHTHKQLHIDMTYLGIARQSVILDFLTMLPSRSSWNWDDLDQQAIPD